MTLFVSKGYPVVIGELGCIDKSEADPLNAESRERWLSFVVSTARELGCIPVYWDNGWNGKNGFGLINRANCEVTQPELAAAIAEAAQTKFNPPSDDNSSESETDSSSETSSEISSVDSADTSSAASSSETASAATSSKASSSSKPSGNADKTPATGNSNAAAMAAALILIAGAGLTVAKSKKK